MPALTLDDGTSLAEAAAVAEYLEEVHPLPALIGSNAKERAQTRQWWRRVELNVTKFIHNAFHYDEGLPRFAPRIPLAPEAAAGLKRIAQDRLAWLDRMMGDVPYPCGERFSAADIWLDVWLDFGSSVNQSFDRSLPKIGPWFERMAARPSARASRKLLGGTVMRARYDGQRGRAARHRRRHADAAGAARRRVSPGMWSYIAGHIEQGECGWQAALREEIALVPESFWATSYCERFYAAASNTIEIVPAFVARVTGDASVRLNAEHSACRWVTLDEATGLLPFGSQRELIAYVRRAFIERELSAVLRIAWG